MRVQVNGSWREVGAATLAAALTDLGYGDAVVTTAMNGEFVACEASPRTLLADGGRIAGLAPIKGGSCSGSTTPRSPRGCCWAQHVSPRPRCSAPRCAPRARKW